MKRFFRIIALIFVMAAVLSLASCSILETEKGNEIKAQCEDMLDAMLAKDADAAYPLFSDATDKNAFYAAFPSLCNYIEGVKTYELTQRGWYAGVKNGTSSYEATFKMETNAKTYYVTGVTVNDEERLYHFSIVSEEECDFVFNGTLTTMQDANVLQWCVIVFSAVCFVFTVWMLVDCCRRKIKHKALWILFIILGMLSFTVGFHQNKLNLNGSIAVILFAYSYLKLYTNGAFVLHLVLPVGALLYRIFRKKLILPPQTETPVGETVGNEAPAESDAKTEGNTEKDDQNV